MPHSANSSFFCLSCAYCLPSCSYVRFARCRRTTPTSLHRQARIGSLDGPRLGRPHFIIPIK
ncbi:TPA: 4Fe-4S dicluster domain-containing protein [Burkholderia vietnamiensis]|nr:4Fe-4S dicluster domain-containing protein [Burkholderia vietnamiensis]MBU9433760.1 4Fe-4S dicluster domain-containing protein [Burkholderia multivorans]HDR9042613.1 4Fe-4S dicluster domain-containing protein [Burkholderia vietnamiensis]HDR9193708.1 4Fe-4S dicluster domain-containing protein [Burkholderia vietnamiensis]